MNKFDWFNRVTIADLKKEQKLLLVEMILRMDESGQSHPSAVRLCKVLGIAHAKNFKGVEHYLPGVFTLVKRGRKNFYVLNTPALEGLLTEAKVNTSHNTPAVEGVNTPAVADNTPAAAEDSPAVEGSNTSLDTSKNNTSDTTEASASATAFLEDNEVLEDNQDDETSLRTTGTDAEGAVQNEPSPKNEVKYALDDRNTEAVKVVVTTKDEALQIIQDAGYVTPVGYRAWSEEDLWKYIEDMKEWVA